MAFGAESWQNNIGAVTIALGAFLIRLGGPLWDKGETTHGATMANLSFGLAKAIAAGRRMRWRPVNREQVLARLLVKRAAAHRAGLDELEGSLREQISWSLPIRNGEPETAG